MNQCPVCQKLAIKGCRCQLGDSECPDGHQWFHCGNCRAPIVGQSLHSVGSRSQINWCVKCKLQLSSCEINSESL
jgi:hypothetical protein